MQRNKIFTQYAQMFQRKMLNLQPIIKGGKKKWQN